ncbi:MAG: hypothetical protein M0004_17640 [Actinomycetota bacterium]|nr:hypothetical protein [Actinomycetota bacterium]
MQQEISASPNAWDKEPSLEHVTRALADHVGEGGEVRPGVTASLVSACHWRGRPIEVLGLLTESSERIAYLAGGFKLEEVARALSLWASSPLSLEEMRTVIESGGWDPEPFAAVASAGLLRQLAYRSDGSLRRVRGELAGAWLSDQFPAASDEEITRAVRNVIASGDVET